MQNRTNVPLYYLVFASKHALGHQFWHAITSYDPGGGQGERTYLTKLETGAKANPSLAILKHLAKAFGVPVAKLLE